MRKIIFALAILAVAVPRAHAQSRDIEITPFGGVRYGGTVDLNGGDFYNYRFKSSWNYGGMLDVGVAPDLMPNLEAEFLWNRQDTELSAQAVATGTYVDLTPAKLDLYQFGLLYAFGDHSARLRPFIVGGLGFTNFHTNGALPFNNKFAFNLGGGVKYFVTNHVGLRVEARYSPTQTTSSLATYCGPYGCYQSTVHNFAQQGEANVGVIFRF
ncbi:MAG TPA: outer membrane beta-barrel protein [Verrucomicrobiae bacterium]|nr:outer membrane beta-barrel protein [Verrucomicrobiae bacterium]